MEECNMLECSMTGCEIKRAWTGNEMKWNEMRNMESVKHTKDSSGTHVTWN